MTYMTLYWVSIVSLLLFVITDLTELEWDFESLKTYFIGSLEWDDIELYGRMIAIIVAVLLAPFTLCLLVSMHTISYVMDRRDRYMNEGLRRWESQAADLADQDIYSLKHKDKVLYYQHMREAAREADGKMLELISRQKPDSKWVDKDLIHAALDELFERSILDDK